ncbi:MAG: S9 family peptidase [Bacteroidales bacterium]
MKRSVFLSILLLSFLSLYSQQKQLSLEQAVLRQRSEFAPKSYSNFEWRIDKPAFTYVDADRIVEVSVPDSKSKDLLLLSDLNQTLKSNSMSELKRLRFQWISKDVIQLYSSPFFVFYNIATRQVEKKLKTVDNSENWQLSPDNSKMAYTINNNLFYIDDKDAEVAITSDSDLGIVNGQSVHRNEFGINKGIFWSPKSNFIAYYRMDETMVTNYPLVDITQRIATVENIRYPMAGMKSHEVTLNIFSIATGTKVAIKTGEPKEQYLTNVAWGPDEKSIYIAVLNREQNHMKLNQYSAETGDFIATLFEETDKEYVEPVHPIQFLPNDPTQFIWQSRRDGWNHLYLYKATGELVKQLTKGEWEVTDIVSIDSKKGLIYFTSTEGSPIGQQLFSVSMKKGSMAKLTVGEGTHNSSMSSDCKYFVDFYSTITIPNRVDLYTSSGKIVKNLITASNPYDGYNVPLPHLVTLNANDGTALYGRIIKPIDFDSTKKYPVVVYVYGGPHSQLVTNSWMGGARLWESYMANKGFILFTLDNRGTSNRGADFEQIIHRQLGVQELADQLVGVKYLKSLNYVDTARIGVHGWSFGGFMTISMMLKAADQFKVGVAGGPVTDWKFYEVMYGERYMDTPEENPNGYSNADLKNFVKNLKGNLLIIHDDMDKTVVLQQSLTLIHEFIKSGQQVDYFIYPQHDHNVIGKDRVNLIDKIIRYFEEKL